MKEIIVLIYAGRPHSFPTVKYEELSGSSAKPADFWNAFIHNPRSLPKHMIVVGDFSEFARVYLQCKKHLWAASVRKSLPVLVALFSTKRDTAYAGLVDDVLKHSDSRLWVCNSMPRSNILTCLIEAIGYCNPRSVIEVRYQPFRNGLWIEFSDGFSGFAGFDQLGMIELRDDLIVETALVGESGYSVQMLKKSGQFFDIDSDSIRATLDAAHAQRLALDSANSVAKLGDIIKHARTRAQYTQTELGVRTGQALRDTSRQP